MILAILHGWYHFGRENVWPIFYRRQQDVDGGAVGKYIGEDGQIQTNAFGFSLTPKEVVTITIDVVA
ncbi:hypothetical protein L1887_07433 [Cichorium endivia]|nr:hypothetical protein L1887_07433 [Cichorium endivia]